jgi:hypothetical protein
LVCGYEGVIIPDRKAEKENGKWVFTVVEVGEHIFDTMRSETGRRSAGRYCAG